MSKYPELKFKLNKPLDKKMAFEFLNYQKDGLDFGSNIIKFHPQLKSVKKIKSLGKKQKLINQYIDRFYSKNKKELVSAKKKLEILWKKNANNFYKKVDKIFNKPQWLKGKYICYISILPCGPRFLENKTFQSFYKLNGRGLERIQHEMLHFIFYDYIKKNFSKKFIKDNQEKIWVLSEIFNAIILEHAPYPAHKKLTPYYQKIWRLSKNIDDFFKKIGLLCFLILVFTTRSL